MDPPRPREQPVSTAEQFGDEFADGQSFRERVSVAAVRAEDGIVGAKVRTHAGGDCFLADVGVAGAMNQPARVTSRELLLRRADQLHGAVEISGVGAHWRPSVRRRRTDPPPFSARLPPSMGISAPVIHSEASDASNTASPLMSSGRPKRPAGMPLRN